MAHPYLRGFHACPEFIVGRELQLGDAVFPALSLVHLSAEVMRNQLVAITDTKHRQSRVQHVRVDVRASNLIHAAWSAGDDDAFASRQFLNGSVARTNISENT